jgi:ABC-type nickel/cobalt efflux system permease component RcnA
VDEESNAFRDDRPLATNGSPGWMSVIAAVVIVLAVLVWIDTAQFGAAGEMWLAEGFAYLAITVFGGTFLFHRWRRRQK